MENNPKGFDLREWLKGHQPERVEPVVNAVIKEDERRGSRDWAAWGIVSWGQERRPNLKDGRLDVGLSRTRVRRGRCGGWKTIRGC